MSGRQLAWPDPCPAGGLEGPLPTERGSAGCERARGAAAGAELCCEQAVVGASTSCSQPAGL